jgi:AAA15 family ATPase/GTPase
MVIQFSVSNYRSIFRTQILNFRATNLVSEDKDVDQRNVAEIGPHRILKSIGIYGANASGKSNVVKAFSFFRNMVKYSLTAENLSPTEINPFKQSTEKIDNSGYFEIVLLIEAKKYRYGFTLNEKADIDSEWLFGPAEKNETYYFTRKNGSINFNPLWFQEGDDLPKEKLRNNALFLSFCASYDGNISKSIKNFISDKVTIDQNFRRRVNRFGASQTNIITDNLIELGKKDVILTWLKEVGLSFSDIKLDKIEVSGKSYGNFVILTKNIYNSNGEIQGDIPMNLDEDESEGTRKFYSYIGRLYQKFEEGGLFVADEIDSNFHPTLLRKLICYFNTSSINKSNAQVLFTSHDTNLMSPDLMRRDQFYFTEKSLTDETIIYSLSDLKGIRNNADFARQYLAGLYGALPILGNYLEEKSKT